MSEEQLKAFLVKVQGDSGLQAKLCKATSPEDVIGIAKENGFELTAEMLNEYDTLTAEELEGVAGGNSYGTALCNLSLSCCQKQHSYCC